MKHAIALLLLLFAFEAHTSTESSLPYYTREDLTPVWKGEFAKETALAKVPPFQMKNQDGQPVSEKTIKGKIAVANFFYASCGSICPGMMNRMREVNNRLAEFENVEMLSFTITPQLDTPEKLSSYAKKRHLNLKRWSLLTGDQVEVRRLETAFIANKDVPSKKEGESVHSENIYLLDQQGHIRGIYNASSWADLDLLVGDAQTLMRK